MGKLIENTLICLIIFVLITLILTFFNKPSCEDLGGTSVAIGERTVIINNAPYRITEYECIREGVNNE